MKLENIAKAKRLEEELNAVDRYLKIVEDNATDEAWLDPTGSQYNRMAILSAPWKGANIAMVQAGHAAAQVATTIWRAALNKERQRILADIEALD